jgi:sulfur-carrier protein
MPELPTISLRYWAGARAAAGCEVEAFAVSTIAEALAAARAARANPHFDRVLSICSLLVDGVVVTGVELLRPRQESIEVEVLPPFAGGAALARPPGPGACSHGALVSRARSRMADGCLVI